jgi:acyl-coenzyme A thioesterase PaaI-like protein
MAQGGLWARLKPGPRALKWLLRLWPTYAFAGIRVRSISPDYSYARVELKLGLLNRNYFGTAFGGSLYAMVDPMYALMLASKLAPAYVVWDKSASIRFLKPGRGRMVAEFRLSPERLEEIRQAAVRDGKHEPHFLIEIRDQQGTLIAEVEKVLYVRPVS